MTFLHLFFLDIEVCSQLGLQSILDISRLLVKTTIYLGISTFSNITIGSLADFQFSIFSMDNHATSPNVRQVEHLNYEILQQENMFEQKIKEVKHMSLAQ